MQKQEAITIIENTFSVAFNEANFTLFVKNFLNDLDTTKYNHYSGNLIKDAFKKHIRQYKRIGKYTDPNGDALDVLLVEVTDQYHLDHARTSIRNFIITHLDSFEKDYALVAFYSNSDGGADWRFSFVKLEYKTEVKEGKIKQNKELTPAKRYSFLVGEHERAHTAKKQLLPLLENIYNNPTVEELEKAFSIEAVTDEFFEQYKTLFVNLTEQFEKDSTLKTELATAGIEIPRFTKKLLGQIVFLYFLQKKGWMGVAKDQKWGAGEKRFLQKLYDEAIDNGKNFFGDYLQFLFYEALAHKHSDEGVQGFYSPLNCKVPFLNGGLFEADYDWKNDHISIPNELFRNQDKIGKNGDIGSGVLDVFDRYNFTIKEDEPLEKEVAVDPEMLGKVFENMLEVTERKSKGAFYTPREIVHYMCQESLIHYLDNAVNSYSKTYQELGNPQISMFGNEVKNGQQSLILENDQILVPKEDIETFIRKGFFTLENDQRVIRVGKETRDYHFQLPETIRTNADLLNTKLAEIRICDPAIGSGAFPVGMLHEIVNARLVLRPHLKNPENQVNPENPDSDNYAYQLKRHTIQECIYGVDIDASAIDIARLRLWLSLVVDEEDLDTIEALPNLDYKIVCGNSLIGLPETAMRDLVVEKELEGLKDDFFKETDENQKKELRTQINSKIRQLLDSAEQFAGYKIDFDFKLFFSEVWHKKGGFDVVIGNPPYIQLQDKTKITQEVLSIYEKQKFETFIKSGDLYNLFYEQGLKINKDKDGFLVFISSNRFCFTNYGKSLRKFLSRRNLIMVLNLNKIEIFKEANVGTLILSVSKRNSISKDLKIAELKYYDKLVSFEEQILKNILIVNKSYFQDLQWGFYNNTILSLKQRILKKSTPLELISDLKINRGITTGLNNVFIVDKDFARIRFSDKINDEILRPVLKGADIKRWRTKEFSNVLIYSYTGVEINKYPEVFNYLNENRNELSNVYEAIKGQKKWYELRTCNYYDSFSCEKLIWTRLSGVNSFALSKEGEFSIDSTSFATGNNLKYYCSLLNSTIVLFYFKLGSVIWGKDGIKWFGEYFDNIPILPPPQNKFLFEILFDYLYSIALINTKKLIFSFWENVLDSMVFELYFPNEIKSANKEILKHLGDLKPLTEEMSPEQKLAIIQSEFERLYDPNHPVRNNVETLDSVEEVRIIREALK